jgi:hypothetical protein
MAAKRPAAKNLHASSVKLFSQRGVEVSQRGSEAQLYRKKCSAQTVF